MAAIPRIVDGELFHARYDAHGRERLDVELLSLIGRTAILWLTALVVFRFMGKRTLGKMGPFDYAVAIMIGEAVAIGMEDTHTPLVNAIAITFALGVLQWLLTWFNVRFRWLEKLTQGTATPVVVNGKLRPKAMRKMRITKSDLFEELRQNDMTLNEVKEARLEPTGKVSVLKSDSSNSGPSSSEQSGGREPGHTRTRPKDGD